MFTVSEKYVMRGGESHVKVPEDALLHPEKKAFLLEFRNSFSLSSVPSLGPGSEDLILLPRPKGQQIHS